MEKKEVDYLMSLNESGVIVHNDHTADENNVLEWLDTPMGSIYGNPSWGHDLNKLKHEPTHSTATALHYEFNIVSKLAIDLPNIQLDSIYCEPSPDHADLYLITIGLATGEVQKTIN